MSKETVEEREERRAAFARLFQAALREQHTGIEALAREVPELSARTMWAWIAEGGRVIQGRQRALVEDVLGWRRDSITDILENPRESMLWSLDDVRKWEPAEAPVRRAAELTTDELLVELTRRVGAMEAELDLYREPSNVIQVEASEGGTVHAFKPKRKPSLSQVARTKMPAEDPKRDTD